MVLVGISVGWLMGCLGMPSMMENGPSKKAHAEVYELMVFQAGWSAIVRNFLGSSVWMGLPVVLSSDMTAFANFTRAVMSAGAWSCDLTTLLTVSKENPAVAAQIIESKTGY